MAEWPSDHNSTGMSAGSESTPGTPRWVKAFGMIAIVLFVLLVILHLTGNGLGGHASPSSGIEHGVQRP